MFAAALIPCKSGSRGLVQAHTSEPLRALWHVVNVFYCTKDPSAYRDLLKCDPACSHPRHKSLHHRLMGPLIFLWRMCQGKFMELLKFKSAKQCALSWEILLKRGGDAAVIYESLNVSCRTIVRLMGNHFALWFMCFTALRPQEFLKNMIFSAAQVVNQARVEGTTVEPLSWKGLTDKQ